MWCYTLMVNNEWAPLRTPLTSGQGREQVTSHQSLWCDGPSQSMERGQGFNKVSDISAFMSFSNYLKRRRRNQREKRPKRKIIRMLFAIDSEGVKLWGVRHERLNDSQEHESRKLRLRAWVSRLHGPRNVMKSGLQKTANMILCHQTSWVPKWVTQ